MSMASSLEAADEQANAAATYRIITASNVDENVFQRQSKELLHSSVFKTINFLLAVHDASTGAKNVFDPNANSFIQSEDEEGEGEGPRQAACEEV